MVESSVKKRKRHPGRRSNCLFFALWLWYLRGGYIALRWSRHIWGVHWVWISHDRRRLLHYTPISPKTNLLAASIDKLWYRGRISRTD